MCVVPPFADALLCFVFACALLYWSENLCLILREANWQSGRSRARDKGRKAKPPQAHALLSGALLAWMNRSQISITALRAAIADISIALAAWRRTAAAATSASKRLKPARVT